MSHRDRLERLERALGEGEERPGVSAETLRRFARGILARGKDEPLVREARAAAEAATTKDGYCRQFWQFITRRLWPPASNEGSN